MNLTLIRNCSFCNRFVMFSAFAALRRTLWDYLNFFFPTRLYYAISILQYVLKTGSSVHKFKHEDYKGLVRRALAYPVIYNPPSRVMRK